MRYLIWLGLIGLVIWWVSGARRRIGRMSEAPPTPPVTTAEMVPCAHCGLHLPLSDALPGRGGHFCSEEHRALFERSHP